MWDKAADLFLLTKPKVLLLMLSTCAVGLVLSKDTAPSALNFATIFLGVFCIAGAGATLNHIFDKHIDKKMLRTQARPLATARVTTIEAGLFAAALLILGSLILLYGTNMRTWLLTLSGSLGYGILYTRLLKFATPQNIAIGGLSGALPPLLGWSAFSTTLDPMSWILVAIIFVWTPPHFWALCLARQEEYATAAVPMLPVTHGYQFTAFFIVLYNILLFPICILPWLIQFLSWRYLLISLLLNSYYLFLNINILAHRKKSCEKSFVFSIIYLYILFLIMLIDRKIFL